MYLATIEQEILYLNNVIDNIQLYNFSGYKQTLPIKYQISRSIDKTSLTHHLPFGSIPQNLMELSG